MSLFGSNDFISLNSYVLDNSHFQLNYAWGIQIVFWSHRALHKNRCIKYIIYQAIRKMVKIVIVDSGEDNTFVTGTGFNFSEFNIVAAQHCTFKSFTY